MESIKGNIDGLFWIEDRITIDLFEIPDLQGLLPDLKQSYRVGGRDRGRDGIREEGWDRRVLGMPLWWDV